MFKAVCHGGPGWYGVAQELNLSTCKVSREPHQDIPHNLHCVQLSKTLRGSFYGHGAEVKATLQTKLFGLANSTVILLEEHARWGVISSTGRENNLLRIVASEMATRQTRPRFGVRSCAKTRGAAASHGQQRNGSRTPPGTVALTQAQQVVFVPGTAP